jgi:hypothetical protein
LLSCQALWKAETASGTRLTPLRAAPLLQCALPQSGLHCMADSASSSASLDRRALRYAKERLQ